MSRPESLSRGVHHVGLTVPDVPAAEAFFREALGFEVVGGKPDYPSVFLHDGTVMLTLWQAEDPATATPFDRRRNLGLHHLSLQVSEAVGLDALHRSLAERSDVEVEFAPEPLGDGPTRHMMCAVPGGLRLELIAPGEH